MKPKKKLKPGLSRSDKKIARQVIRELDKVIKQAQELRRRTLRLLE